MGRFASARIASCPRACKGYDRYAYANNSPVNFTDPSGHFGKHNDDKSDYWNKRNQGKVKELEGKWEKEKAMETLQGLMQQTSKEYALDPSLGFSSGLPGGSRGLHALGSSSPHGGTYTPWDFWNDPEALSRASLAGDAIALGLDVLGEGMAIGGLIAGGPAGYLEGNALAQSTTNFLGDRVSMVSTLFTARADYLNGASSEIFGVSIPVGHNTINSAFTTAAGFTPDTTIDVLASGCQFFINDNPGMEGFPAP